MLLNVVLHGQTYVCTLNKAVKRSLNGAQKSFVFYDMRPVLEKFNNGVIIEQLLLCAYWSSHIDVFCNYNSFLNPRFFCLVYFKLTSSFTENPWANNMKQNNTTHHIICWASTTTWQKSFHDIHHNHDLTTFNSHRYSLNTARSY